MQEETSAQRGKMWIVDLLTELDQSAQVNGKGDSYYLVWRGQGWGLKRKEGMLR
jgi:hypothetical protein